MITGWNSTDVSNAFGSIEGYGYERKKMVDSKQTMGNSGRKLPYNYAKISLFLKNYLRQDTKINF